MGFGASKSAATAGVIRQDGGSGGAQAGTRKRRPSMPSAAAAAAGGGRGSDGGRGPSNRPSTSMSNASSQATANNSNFDKQSKHGTTTASVEQERRTSSVSRDVTNGNQHPSPPSHPLVVPASTRKGDIFQPRNYEARDKYACSLPESLLYKSYTAVAEYLTADARNDLDRVRTIFRWIASLDLSALQSRTTVLPDPGTPLDYLLKINWRMGNHANFTALLSRAAGLHCFVVNGINKSVAYQLGKPCDKRAMAAQWNAVCVDGQWRLMDVFWASTCLVGRHSSDWALVDNDGEIVSPYVAEEEEGETMHTVNEFFFIPDADHLIATHLPDDPKWQLLTTPVTFEEFESGVYLRDRFFQLDLQIPDELMKRGTVPTSSGHAVVTLQLPAQRSAKYDFRYLLFKSKQTTADSSIPYERFVLYQKKSDSISYSAHFPVAGLFRLDVFGIESGILEGYDLVCSYLIDCQDPDTAAQPLPDCPDIGWGPGDVAEKAGLTAKTHGDAVIETSDGVVDIRFAIDPRVRSVLQSVLHNDLDAWLLSRNAVLREENGELVVSMRLAQKGEYALKLFADSAATHQEFENDLQNVCNYLIRCLKSNEEVRLFPKLHEGIIGKSAIADELGVTATSHADSLINTDTGQVTLNFSTKSDDIKIACEVNNNDIDKAKLTSCVSTSNPDRNKTQFDLSLPGPGEYAVNVYAYKENDPTRLHHVHTYLMTSTQSASDGEVTQRDKLASGSNDDVSEMTISKDKVEVRIPGHSRVVGELRRKNALPSLAGVNERLTSTAVGDEQVLTASLPENGDYLLDVFRPQPGGGALERLRTFAISRVERDGGDNDDHDELANGNCEESASDNKKPEKPPEPELTNEQKEKIAKEKALEAKKQGLKESLRLAISGQDEEQLRKAIASANGTLSAKELENAKKMLEFLVISRELADAMRNRRLTALEKVIAAAEKAGLEKRLGIQLAMARRILEQLQRIEKLRHAILNLDQKTIAELKSYAKPPIAVHHVMTATFLLLGEPDKNLRDWREVQVFLGKTGRESFKRRVSAFDVEKLSLALAHRVKTTLKSYQLNDIRDVSAGAATFYVWTIGMIEEAEALKSSM